MSDIQTDEQAMALAIELAQQAAQAGEVPVGAVVVRDGVVIGQGSNAPISGCDPTAHAEILALRSAAESQGNYRLPGATLYVTVEPCTMCFGALVHARIARLVYGAAEPKAGVVSSQLGLADRDFYNHKVVCVGGVLAERCGELMAVFFAGRRREKKSS